jgi:RimJ/RimL family protein N-acetyltransferase
MFAAAPEVRTDRLLLRGWQQTDLAPFAALNADPAVVEFLGPLDRVASDAFVARIQTHWSTHGFGLFAVQSPAGFIGFVGLARVPFPAAFTPAVEIGWRLAHAAWGRGYATEAARAVLEFAWADLRLPDLVSFTAAGNLRSRAVMERLGMSRDPAEDFDHPLVAPDEPLCRHVLYRLVSPRPAGPACSRRRSR